MVQKDIHVAVDVYIKGDDCKWKLIGAETPEREATQIMIKENYPDLMLDLIYKEIDLIKRSRTPCKGAA